uniref:Sodium-coupled neutral amino acid transporter 3-like n=1 Tax=Salarias fasciatus TaxID=181472 RepID=A0A672GJY2_SALFA
MCLLYVVTTPVFLMTSPHRTENAEANLPENQEFLSGVDDKKTTRFTDFEGKTSFGMSVFNLGNAIMGSGILGLAYAMANAGNSLTCFTPCFHSFIAILQAFGTPGKMAAGIAITLQNIGAMSSYLYIVKYEFPLVIQAFLKLDNPAGEWYMNGNYLVIIVSIAVILPLALMKQLGYLGYTSGFSLSCMVFFLIAVRPSVLIQTREKRYFIFLFCLLCDSCRHTQMNRDPPPPHRHHHLFSIRCSLYSLLWTNVCTAYTIPILAFAFVCHPEVLPIYTELRNATKKKMQHVANISIAVMYIMYFLAALFGYLTFYGKVEAELLHTYSSIDPYDTLILCVRVAVLTAVTLTVPIVLFPVRRAIQQMMFPNKTFYWPRHIAIAFVLLTFINLLVIFAPNILGIFGVIGATSAPCLIFIFPAIFYIRIVPKEEEPLRSPQKILAACFAGLGFLFMIMSLSFIIIDWTSGTSKAASGH